MKLDKLAGFGPTAAFVIGVAGILFGLCLLFGTAIHNASAAAGDVVTVVEFICFWVIPIALLVVALDLEWIEHPATTDFWLAASHIAAIAAIVLPIVVAVSGLLRIFVLAGVAALATVILVGLVLLIHNAEARRAGLLHGPLLWIGYISGVGLIATGFLPLLFPVGAIGLIVGLVALIIWSIWLGTLLRGAKQLATSTPAEAGP